MQTYQADMLRLLLMMHIPPQYRDPDDIPRLTDVLRKKPGKKMTADKATSFVDNMILAFRKGGRK